MKIHSWGRLQDYDVADCQYLRFNQLTLDAQFTYIPYGNGRCYGDECINEHGGVIQTHAARHFLRFDALRGLLTVEAGALLADILDFIVPQGWFLPVVPGTQFVTVGGAIANDIHGKNQHARGSFASSLVTFELLRSDGQRYQCSPQQNAEFYAATLGGAGLTGLITQATLQLMPIESPWLAVKNIRFANLEEFFTLSETFAKEYEYSVAWIDCLAVGKRLGRGWLFLGKHIPQPLTPQKYRVSQKIYPVRQPFSLVNRYSLKLFNQLYYHRPLKNTEIQHYQKFFFPLDGIKAWNRIYGRQGFYQYQCVLPKAQAEVGIAQILALIAKHKMGSFLAVLKVFGESSSPGLLSFCKEGVSLALDFPNQGARSLQLFEALDGLVLSFGGRVYLAKDARMSAETFRQFYPKWRHFKNYIDPRFSSNMARRLELV
jgi:FAD/FMN-containing dehydrogenase